MPREDPNRDEAGVDGVAWFLKGHPLWPQRGAKPLDPFAADR